MFHRRAGPAPLYPVPARTPSRSRGCPWPGRRRVSERGAGRASGHRHESGIGDERTHARTRSCDDVPDSPLRRRPDRQGRVLHRRAFSRQHCARTSAGDSLRLGQCEDRFAGAAVKYSSRCSTGGCESLTAEPPTLRYTRSSNRNRKISAQPEDAPRKTSTVRQSIRTTNILDALM